MHDSVESYPYKEKKSLCFDKDDTQILNDICDYFEKRTEKNDFLHGSRDSSTWSGLVNSHKEVSQYLKNRDFDNLRPIFNTISTSILSQGISDPPYTGSKHLYGIHDKLISICEYAGVIQAFNPEWPAHYDYRNRNPDEYLKLLEDRYCFDISAPKYAGGLIGLETSYGVYGVRDMWALNLALMIRDKYESNDIKICEIGGGMGYLAYYLTKLGFKNITIVDLPTISVVQMYFLKTNLSDFFVTEDDYNIALMDPETFTGEYDIVINMDSIVEMGRETAIRYLEIIKSKGSTLISVNQETCPSGFKLSDVTDMKRLCRHRYWTRKGWLYEEYVGEHKR